jgi:hypothetical protein
MIFLIGGAFFGLLAVLNLASGSVAVGLWWSLPAVVFIAAGIQQITRGRPEPPTPAELQKRLRDFAQSGDVERQRLVEWLRKVDDPAQLRRLAEELRQQGPKSDRKTLELIEQRLAEVRNKPKQPG